MLSLLISGAGHHLRALDAQALPSEYSRQQWSAEDGFRIGQVSSIAQTPDGYLWIGGEEGLVSFDGEKFQPAPPSGNLPITHVLGLTTDGQGALWIWMQGANVLRYAHGKFTNVSNQLGLPDDNITALSSGTKGSVLLSTLGQQIFEYDGGHVHEIGWTNIPNTLMLALAKTSDGRVWAGTRDNGLSYIESQSIVSLSGKTAPKKINCLLRNGEKSLWVGTDEGLFLWNGSILGRVPGPVSFARSQILSMVQDRDGNLWCGTEKGLFRVGRRFLGKPVADGPFLKESITGLFQDREGGLWIGTGVNLQRWKDFAFRQIGGRDDQHVSLNGPIYVDDQGTVWAASSKGGLYRVTQTGLEECRPDVFGKDLIYSLSGRNGDIWAARQNGGLTHLHRFAGRIAAETFTARNGLAQDTVFSVFEARDGTIWAGTLSGGLSRFKDGRWSTFTTTNGLPSNDISSISEDQQGTVWVATSAGLASLSRDHWHVYDHRAGLLSDEVSSLLPDLGRDGNPILWVGTAQGLVLLRSGSCSTIRSDSDIFREPIWGMTKDSDGYLWLSTPNHLARVSRDQLLVGNVDSTNVRVYVRADGVKQFGGVKRTRSIETDATGRVWIGTIGGLIVTNSTYMQHRAATTIVDIDSIVADSGALDVRSPRMPAPQRRIVFHYAGLNFAVSDRIRFRYRLDGYDKDWSDPVGFRQAVYTHLDPGSYRFRVIASNGEGQWNSAEASVPLVIEPAAWQTWWFRCISLLSAALLIWCAYLFRMRQIAAQNHLILEERLAERMRIAQDLHDTLLQSFHALMLRFQAVSNMLPNRSLDAKQLLDNAIDRAAEALTESRDAVQKLRTPLAEDTDLAEVLTRLGHELRSGHSEVTPMPAFRVLIEGIPQRINPFVRDDLYRIGREAIGNAFRHAQAHQIEVELRYEPHALALRVRDDGLGMDSHLRAGGGRDGHWGLPGMRERTKALGGRFTLWSELRRGTEIEASIPGRRAYDVLDEPAEMGRLGS